MDIKSDIKKEKDRSFEAIATVSAKIIKEKYQKALKKLVVGLEVKGFRKGQVPKNVAEEKLGKEKIYQTFLPELLEEVYEKIVTEHNLQPVVYPEISLVSAKDEEDWTIKFSGAEKPEADLGNLLEEIKKENAKGAIWTPKSDSAAKPTPEEKSKEREKRINAVVSLILKTVKIIIPEIIVKKETEVKLSDLVAQLQTAGLTLEQHLAAQGLTIEQLKEKYRQETVTKWKMELVLGQISEDKKITVSEEEIKKITEKGANSYLAARILRLNKTLDFLLNL